MSVSMAPTSQSTPQDRFGPTASIEGVSDRQGRGSILRSRRNPTRVVESCASVILGLLLLFVPQRLAAQPVPDVEAYHRAVDYCRSDVPRPTAISPDRTIACFSGPEGVDVDASVVSQIADNGLFVVRGFGGKSQSAMSVSELLRSRNATVVVFDTCVFSCADYYFVASARTYVVRGTIVQWQHVLEHCHVTFRVPRDSSIPKLWRAECPKGKEWSLAYATDSPVLLRFYQDRVIDPFFLPLPDSEYVRKRLKWLYDQTGRFPGIGWMLSPASLKRIFKADIIYEAYPQSQDEATALVNRFGARDVIYDP
ncbi:MAG: hypothetical protein WA418_18695 [Bradyrhizobium sp.]